MTIKDIQNELIEDFAMFDNWQEKYEYLIDLGKNLPAFEDSEKKEKYIINGCQSKVWLMAEFSENKKVVYRATSDAIIPKGIISLLLSVYSNKTTNEILGSSDEFINQIGLSDFLSPTRANGLFSMIKQIKLYALAFDKMS